MNVRTSEFMAVTKMSEAQQGARDSIDRQRFVKQLDDLDKKYTLHELNKQDPQKRPGYTRRHVIAPS